MTTLTMKDEKRIEVIQRVFREELTVVEAAMVGGVSERQQARSVPLWTDFPSIHPALRTVTL